MGCKGFLGSFRIKQMWFLKEGVAVDCGDLGILALGILENHSLILLKKKKSCSRSHKAEGRRYHV